MNLINQIVVYPSSLKDNRLDCRIPGDKHLMFVGFNYIHEPETDDEIITHVIKRFRHAPEMESVREYLTTAHEETTYFKPRLSLS